MTEQEFSDPHRLVSAGVVVGVDGSAGGMIAVRWAADFAERRGRELQLVHALNLIGAAAAVGPHSGMTPAIIDAVKDKGRRVIHEALDTVRAEHPRLKVSAHLFLDPAPGLLIDLAARAYAVVLGATGDAGTLAHLGSTLLSVTAHAPGTVIVVRPEGKDSTVVRDSGPVVVGVDGSPLGEAALATAFAEASERGADLIAMHCWTDWSAGKFAGEHPTPLVDEAQTVEESLLAECLAGWQEKYPDVAVTRRVYFSAPAAQLRELSKVAQLVVVGNRGRGGFLGMLLGSTAHALVQHAHCPVMVVHRAD